MLLTGRWLGEIGPIGDDGQVSVDAAGLVRHLITFDEVVVQSGRLLEIAPLIRCFGFDGVVALLRSGAMRVHCNNLTVGQTGQLAVLEKRSRKGLLPLHSYSFSAIKAGRDRKEHVRDALRNVQDIDDLSFKEGKTIVREIAGRLIDPVEAVETSTIEQLRADLRANAPHITTALLVELRRRYGALIGHPALHLKIYPIDAEDFAVETNLQLALRISEQESHDAIAHALLAVAGLNQRLAEMQHYSALVNLWYRDLPVLDEKLSYIRGIVAPEHLDGRLAEVLSLPMLPDLSDAIQQGEFDMVKFLDVRSSDEGRAFRAWVQTAVPEDRAELRERAESFRVRLGSTFQSTGGRMARLLVSTGLGFVPGATLASAIAGPLDALLLDRLFGRVPAPLTFLLHRYSSVFRVPDKKRRPA